MEGWSPAWAEHGDCHTCQVNNQFFLDHLLLLIATQFLPSLGDLNNNWLKVRTKERNGYATSLERTEGSQSYRINRSEYVALSQIQSYHFKYFSIFMDISVHVDTLKLIFKMDIFLSLLNFSQTLFWSFLFFFTCCIKWNIKLASWKICAEIGMLHGFLLLACLRFVHLKKLKIHSLIFKVLNLDSQPNLVLTYFKLSQAI